MEYRITVSFVFGIHYFFSRGNLWDEKYKLIEHIVKSN